MFGLKARDRQILCLWSPTLLFTFLLIVYVSKPCHRSNFHSEYELESNGGRLPCPCASTADKRIFQQDDKTLVEYVRKHHMTPPSLSKYNLNPSMSSLTTETHRNITAYLKTVLNEKRNGFFIETTALDGELFSHTLRLEKYYSWDGLLIEPMQSLFKILQTKNRKAWIADVCLSGEAPKYMEVNILKQVHSRYITEAKAYYHSQITNQNGIVQCFPLFTLLSAIKVSDNVVDLLILNSDGAEYEILKAIPFDIVKIRVILVQTSTEKMHRVLVRRFLESKGYKLDKRLVTSSHMAFVLHGTGPHKRYGSFTTV